MTTAVLVCLGILFGWACGRLDGRSESRRAIAQAFEDGRQLGGDCPDIVDMTWRRPRVDSRPN